MNIDGQIAELKAKLDKLQRDNVRAETNREVAISVYDNAVKQLQEEFELDSLGHARAKLEELEEKLAKELTEVAKLLNDVEI